MDHCFKSGGSLQDPKNPGLKGKSSPAEGGKRETTVSGSRPLPLGGSSGLKEPGHLDGQKKEKKEAS